MPHVRIQVDDAHNTEDVVLPPRFRRRSGNRPQRRRRVALYEQDERAESVPHKSKRSRNHARPLARTPSSSTPVAAAPSRSQTSMSGAHSRSRTHSTAFTPRAQPKVDATSTPVTPESKITVKEGVAEQQRNMYYDQIANKDKLLEETPASRVHLGTRPMGQPGVQQVHAFHMPQQQPSPPSPMSSSGSASPVSGTPQSARQSTSTPDRRAFYRQGRSRRKRRMSREQDRRHDRERHRSRSHRRRRGRTPRTEDMSPDDSDVIESEDERSSPDDGESPTHTPMDPVESKRIKQLAELIQWQETGLDIEDYFDNDTDPATIARIHAKAKRKMGQSHYVQNGKAMIVGIAAFIEKAFRTGRSYGFNVWDVDGWSMSMADPEENEKFNVPLMRAYQMYARGQDESNPFVTIAITMAFGAWMFSQEKQRAQEEMQRFGRVAGPTTNVDTFIQQNPAYAAAISQRMGVAIRVAQQQHAFNVATPHQHQHPRQPMQQQPPMHFGQTQMAPPMHRSVPPTYAPNTNGARVGHANPSNSFQDSRQWSHGPPSGTTFQKEQPAPTPQQVPAPRSPSPYEPRELFKTHSASTVPPRQYNPAPPRPRPQGLLRRPSAPPRSHTQAQAPGRLPQSVIQRAQPQGGQVGLRRSRAQPTAPRSRAPRKPLASGWTLDDDVFQQQQQNQLRNENDDDMLSISDDELDVRPRRNGNAANSSDDEDEVVFEHQTSTPGTVDLQWGTASATS